MTTTTTITITDPVLLKQLAEAKGPILFRDAAGKVLHISGEGLWAPPEGYVPPIPQEELERRSQNREGRPLKDILQDLREKFGSRITPSEPSMYVESISMIDFCCFEKAVPSFIGVVSRDAESSERSA